MNGTNDVDCSFAVFFNYCDAVTDNIRTDHSKTGLRKQYITLKMCPLTMKFYFTRIGKICEKYHFKVTAKFGLFIFLDFKDLLSALYHDVTTPVR